MSLADIEADPSIGKRRKLMKTVLYIEALKRITSNLSPKSIDLPQTSEYNQQFSNADFLPFLEDVKLYQEGQLKYPLYPTSNDTFYNEVMKLKQF